METALNYYPKRDFAAISDCTLENSRVISLADEKILLVECNKQNCKYRLLFGNSVICLDPKRKEMYKSCGK